MQKDYVTCLYCLCLFMILLETFHILRKHAYGCWVSASSSNNSNFGSGPIDRDTGTIVQIHIDSFLDMGLNAARKLSQSEPTSRSLFMERLLQIQVAHAERIAAYEEELQRQLRLRRLALRNLQRRRTYYKTTGIRLKVGKIRLWSVAV